MMDEKLKQLWEKIKVGGPYTDAELAYGIQKLTPVRDALFSLGPEFHFSWRELNRIIMSFEDYQSARATSRRH
jgi:hypothetical protein